MSKLTTETQRTRRKHRGLKGIRASVLPPCPLCLCDESYSPHTQVRSVPRFRLALALLLCLSLLTGGCFETEESEPFYGQVVVPRAQEFRWSDGGLPRVFDPALAATPPDTDAVRAMFEGLTDYDPRTLRPVSAVATHWESSPDARTWTFHLRKDARWSNGDAVTAQDFVRSWQRTLRLGARAPHVRLLENIEGAASVAGNAAVTAAQAEGPGDGSASVQPPPEAETPLPQPATPFGAQAINQYLLRVQLKRPDVSFPALVAHPVFRPVHELGVHSDVQAPPSARQQGSEAVGVQKEKQTSGGELVTNGAFSLAGYADSSLLLERARLYWDASAVKLERVRFVAARDSEEALAAYRAGRVDAVTNAAFEPLAVKLLKPYKDFRRSTFGALNFYRFNTARPPFDDRRVREAFALALDLERLSADTLGGATEPARKFLPTPAPAGNESAAADKSEAAKAVTAGAAPHKATADESKDKSAAPDGATVETETADKTDAAADEADADGKAPGGEPAAPLRYDPARARQLLAEAGFPAGRGFPRRVRLLINRNDQQRIVAQAVRAMWRSVLGVETDIVALNWDEYEALIRLGDYDVVRRSVVMQTTDEETTILAMFAAGQEGADALAQAGATPVEAEATPSAEGGGENIQAPHAVVPESVLQKPILTEGQALRELPAIPLYFPSAYALVKPYVRGFDANLLDAPSLKHVEIDTGWKPPARKEVVTFGAP